MGVAQAADKPDANQQSLGSLEEIIVTGTKRDIAAQNVPISISAISAADLANSHVNNIRALQSLAPGLVLSNPAGFNAAGGGMRGTGTNIILVTQDAPVSFLVDDFALSHVTSQFVSLFDTDHIEVYRGPQGTLFGKNTTGGVISITSKKPELTKYYSEDEFTYGQYRNGAAIASVKTAINVPLTDTLAFRLAAIYDYDAGYYTDDKHTSTFPNVPLWGAFGIPVGTPLPAGVDPTVTGRGGRLGGKNVLAAKGKFLWKPTDWYTGYLIGEVSRDRSDSPPGVNESAPTDLLPALGFPGIQAAGQTDVFSTLITHNPKIQEDQGHRVDTTGVYLTQTFAIPTGEIKSITGYRDQQQRLPSTYTGEAFTTLFDSSRNTVRRTFEQELRYASKFDGPFNFVTGANYNHDSFKFIAFFSVGLTSLIPVQDPTTGTFVTPQGTVSLDTRALSDYQLQGTQQRRREEAVFWDGTYKFTDKFGFTAGVRYSKDHKDFLRFVDGGGPCTALTEPQDRKIVAGVCHDTRSQYISRAGLLPGQFDNGFNSPLPLSAFGTQVNTSNDWSKTTFRAVFDYHFTASQMAYLSYATGFLSGGFSETCATVSRCAYNPETNKNLELGYKADLLDNKLRFNVAVYQTKYQNLQRAVVAAYTAADGTGQQETVTINTGSSKATGVDVETTWVPTRDLRLEAALNYLNHKYTSGSVPDLVHIPAGPATDLTQYRVPFSPRWKGNLGASYDVHLPAGSRVTLHGDWNYQSEAETDVYNTVNTQMMSRSLVNLSTTYHDKEDRWSVTAWCANVGDKVYRIAALPVAGLWNFTNYGAPRSFGLTMNLSFQ